MRVIVIIGLVMFLYGCGGHAPLSGREQLKDSVLVQIDSSFQRVVQYDVQLEGLYVIKDDVGRIQQHIIDWSYNQTLPDAPFKVEAKVLLNDSVPARMESLKAQYVEMKIRLYPIEESYGKFKEQCELVMQSLPDYESYNDVAARFGVEPIITKGGDLELTYSKVVEDIEWAINRIKAMRAQEIAVIKSNLERYKRTNGQ